jgi:hypothetical protein
LIPGYPSISSADQTRSLTVSVIDIYIGSGETFADSIKYKEYIPKKIDSQTQMIVQTCALGIFIVHVYPGELGALVSSALSYAPNWTVGRSAVSWGIVVGIELSGIYT